MAIDRRCANGNWQPARADGTISWDRVDTALLMDIRDELRRLNAVLACPNFLAIPHKLDQIAAQTKKRKYVRRGKE